MIAVDPAQAAIAIDVLARVLAELAFFTPLGPAEATPDQAFLVGVRHHGFCEGRVVLALAQGLSEEAARTLLCDDPAQAEAQAGDAACELANVLANHLLCALHGPASEFRLDGPEILATDRIPAVPPLAVVEFAEGSAAVWVMA